MAAPRPWRPQYTACPHPLSSHSSSGGPTCAAGPPGRPVCSSKLSVPPCGARVGSLSDSCTDRLHSCPARPAGHTAGLQALSRCVLRGDFWGKGRRCPAALPGTTLDRHVATDLSLVACVFPLGERYLTGRRPGSVCVSRLRRLTLAPARPARPPGPRALCAGQRDVPAAHDGPLRLQPLQEQPQRPAADERRAGAPPLRTAGASGRNAGGARCAAPRCAALSSAVLLMIGHAVLRCTALCCTGIMG